MNFTLEPDVDALHVDALRNKVRRFVADEILPLEQDATAYDEHENIAEPVLARVREEAPDRAAEEIDRFLPRIGWTTR